MGDVMVTRLQVSLYSYKFISETLFPHEQYKSTDVQPGGKLYYLTQVFLDKISPQHPIPVELLFTARSDESNFRAYKINNQQTTALQAPAKKVSQAFKQLTHQSTHIEDNALTFLKKISKFTERLQVHNDRHDLDQKFLRSFEAVEECLKANPEKLRSFETILSDWSKATPGFRAKAINFDPFIGQLWNAIKTLC